MSRKFDVTKLRMLPHCHYTFSTIAYNDRYEREILGVVSKVIETIANVNLQVVIWPNVYNNWKMWYDDNTIKCLALIFLEIFWLTIDLKCYTFFCYTHHIIVLELNLHTSSFFMLSRSMDYTFSSIPQCSVEKPFIIICFNY